MADPELDTLINTYFDTGMVYKDIVKTLSQKHNIVLGERQLKRRLSNLNLHRRQYDRLSTAVHFIQGQLRRSGQLHGYRIMHAKCLQSGIRVRKEDVRLIIKAIDPVGVEFRSRGVIRRRNYFAKGPNYVWHIDGYDKLKPYGLCIHGSIDGYSRRVIWLNVYHTNNDPQLIGGYFLEAAEECGGCPTIVRADRGTENGHIRDFQELLRPNGPSESPYIEGKSTANQRIEAFWSYLRKEFTQFWIDFFKDLSVTGEFSGDFLDKSLVQFCFMSIIQSELDDNVKTWNTHIIRATRQGNPNGRPDVMYFAPHLWGASDQLHLVCQHDIDTCWNQATVRENIPCDEDVFNICMKVITRDNLDFPIDDPYDALALYRHLQTEILLLL